MLNAERSSGDGLLDRLRGRTVLVVGDVMLDQFVIGRVDRISPEAPVPVVLFEHEEFRLGGAANVAVNIAAMGGRAECIGVAGEDAEAERLAGDMAHRGIGTGGIVTDRGRRTTRKLRIVTTRNQQVARVDYEHDHEISGEVERRVLERIESLSAQADAILVSDYLKGVVSRLVAAAAVRAAQQRAIPLLVDPKVPHVDYYAGATVVTPNDQEAVAVTHMRIRSAEDARHAARRFRERVACESVLITRGEHGMWLLAPEGEVELPAEAREVADVTGAGDTVIGVLALGLAAGGSLADAARLANRAAGIVVGRFGPATVTADELRTGN
ncbi:MAG TPA: D-glycero-beta-D-manno-heptose-7-phosphate kinase [Vicinamibacterales bacterium]|nr:D-glycero-beta-D-manno-heptose-7-phosphate kinase [Vicinamibacterales bacterium]